jgi:hypothetical protein
MKSLKFHNTNSIIRLISLLAVECFIVSNIAPDYQIRSLAGSSHPLKADSRQLKSALSHEAPDCLAPPLATSEFGKDKAEDVIGEVLPSSSGSKKRVAEGRTGNTPNSKNRSLNIYTGKSVVIVIDMQNDFCSMGAIMIGIVS